MQRLTYQEAIQPKEITCARCKGVAWIVPFLGDYGVALCGRCTFGEPGLSLVEMLKRLYGAENETKA